MIVVAMILTVACLAGLGILLAASIGALREAIRQRARIRGILITLGLMALSLLGIWAVLI